MLPWSFTEQGAAEEIHAAAAAQYVGHQCQAGRYCRSSPAAANGSRSASPADPLYQHLLLTAEKKFWRCVESGEPPPFRRGAAAATDRGGPDRRYERLYFLDRVRRRVSDVPAGLSGARRAKAELKSPVPEDAKEAIGHGVRAKRRNRAQSRFDLLKAKDNHAAVQCSIGTLADALAQSTGRARQSGEIAGALSGRMLVRRADLPYAPLSSGLDIVRKTLGQ